jgi:hypothetical protein
MDRTLRHGYLARPDRLQPLGGANSNTSNPSAALLHNSSLGLRGNPSKDSRSPSWPRETVFLFRQKRFLAIHTTRCECRSRVPGPDSRVHDASLNEEGSNQRQGELSIAPFRSKPSHKTTKPETHPAKRYAALQTRVYSCPKEDSLDAFYKSSKSGHDAPSLQKLIRFAAKPIYLFPMLPSSSERPRP